MSERLSAWMDGELETEQAHQLPSQARRDAGLRRNWDRYHLIRDALRGVRGPDLSAKIYARLDAEPTVLAPQRHIAAEMLHRSPLQVAASIAAVAFVGWMALSGLQQDPPPIAAIPAPEVKEGAVLAGEDVNDYLLAHQRYSASNAMHGIVPYVRTVAEKRRSDGW